MNVVADADQAGPEKIEAPNAQALLMRIIDVAPTRSAEDKTDAWADIHQADAMAAIATEWRFNTENISNLLSVLEAIPGQVSKARSLRKAVQRLAEQQARRESEDRLSDPNSDLGQLISLADALGAGAPPPSIVAHSVLQELRVPRGYAIGPSGVSKMSISLDGSMDAVRMAPAPIFIISRTEDVHSGEAKRQVVWRGPSGWCSRTLDRRTILDTGRIIQLASIEAPVNSIIAAQLVTYLADFEAENQHRFPSIRSAGRMGWLPDGGFLLPDGYYATDEEPENSAPYALTAPTGFERLAGGWKTHGEYSTWLTGVEMVLDSPLMMIALYASVTAPLLKILRIPGFVVDFSGETSGGKTTALKFAASVWGRPAESYPTAMYSWDSTKVWIERTAGFLHNLPLILDETKRAKSPSIVRDVIYDFCQGQGRGRGSVDGTRAIDTWQSVMLSSGEGSATSFSEDAGTRARVISLKGKPLGNNPDKGGQISEELQHLLVDNYGHLGRAMIKYLVGNHRHHDAIRAVFSDARTRYAAEAQTAVTRRMASHIAALEVASAIVHQLGVPEPYCNPFDYLVEAAIRAGVEADRPLVAMQDVLTWCASNKARFWGRNDTLSNGAPLIPPAGWLGAWDSKAEWEYIAISSVELRRFLATIGHHPGEVIERWDERGWLVKLSGGNSRTRPVRIGGVQARCYCLSRAATNMALLDDTI